MYLWPKEPKQNNGQQITGYKTGKKEFNGNGSSLLENDINELLHNWILKELDFVKTLFIADLLFSAGNICFKGDAPEKIEISVCTALNGIEIRAVRN